MKEGLSPNPTPNSLDAQHSIIAYACNANEALSGDLNALYLPHLAALLGKMTCVANGFTPSDREHGKHSEAAYLMPHESALSIFGLNPNGALRPSSRPATGKWA